MKAETTRDKSTMIQRFSIRTLLYSEGFGFLFSLSILTGLYLDRNGVAFGDSANALRLLFWSFLISPVVAMGVYKLLKFSDAIRETKREAKSVYQVPAAEKTEDMEQDQKRPESEVFWIWFVLLLLGWLPIFLAYYPGVFSYDAEGQLYQVIAYDYSTHHPLLHTMFLGLFLRLGEKLGSINKGIAVHSITQMILMAACMAYTLKYLYRMECSKVLRVLLGIFWMLFPVNSILVISTTKDILFAGLVMVFVVRIHEWSLTGDEEILKWTLPILSWILLLRNNAIYALVGSIPFYFLILRKNRRFPLAEDPSKSKTARFYLLIGLSVVIFVGMSMMLKVGLKAHNGSPREMLSVPIQQMAHVRSIHYEELSEEDQQMIGGLIQEEWYERYDRHLADPIKERISFDDPKAFVTCWIKLGLRYPGDYIDAWLLTEEGLWYLPDRSSARIYGEGLDTGFGLLSTDIRNMPAGYEVTDESKLPRLRYSLECLVSANAFEKVPILRFFFTPGLYIWMFFLYLLLMFYGKNRRMRLPAVFLFVYYLTLLLSPAVLMRYVYYLFLSAPVLLILLTAEKVPVGEEE